ncbi:MAG: hypothetical protein A2255_09725 [Candidatus Melainabacteria bacterium RIFOXYA2_FULL_32_9]|nr:MAG: hypothetical protein A2255_09725 [Candidatus Melainabacteria bacterium RIFOXYA2_FULL_32_9]
MRIIISTLSLLLMFLFITNPIMAQVPNIPPRGLSATQIYKQAAPATVVIRTDDDSQGSGIILHPSGIILTNFHVIEGAKKDITVKLQDGKTYKVTGIGTVNPLYDFALIKINPQRSLPIVQMGNSERLEPGEEIFAISTPKGLEFSISDGIISQVKSDVMFCPDCIQFTAPVSPGSSGGGLFNNRGELVGIIAARFPSATVQNINFATPINIIKSNLNNQIRSLSNYSGSITSLLQSMSDPGLLGIYYLRHDEPDLAIEFFEKSIPRHSSDPELQGIESAILAELYLDKFTRVGDTSNLQNAKSYFNRAISLGFKEPEVYTGLGITAVLLNDTQSYRIAYNELLKIDPEQAQELSLFRENIATLEKEFEGTSSKTEAKTRETKLRSKTLEIFNNSFNLKENEKK